MRKLQGRARARLQGSRGKYITGYAKVSINYWCRPAQKLILRKDCEVDKTNMNIRTPKAELLVGAPPAAQHKLGQSLMVVGFEKSVRPVVRFGVGGGEKKRRRLLLLLLRLDGRRRAEGGPLPAFRKGVCMYCGRLFGSQSAASYQQGRSDRVPRGKLAAMIAAMVDRYPAHRTATPDPTGRDFLHADGIGGCAAREPRRKVAKVVGKANCPKWNGVAQAAPFQ